jgi:hypothetical protein
VRYALLIYAGEGEPRSAELDLDLRAEGKLLADAELQPVTTATTVQVRQGDTLVGDGPYAETEEPLRGLYVIEADTLDEAIEWAARIPAAGNGTIEVRPVVDRTRNGA